VSLLHTVRNLARRFHLLHDAHRDPHERKTNQRICQLEELETRRAMAVAPIHLGSVYYEEATGDDSAPDVIEITFNGGAPGTQLTQLIINGDKDGNGLSVGDMFWDISAGGKGTFNHVPLSIVSSNGFVVSSITLVDGGTLMVIDATGWDAGEKLVISLDVDEQGSINSTAVAEGGEWEGTIMTGTFVSPNYETINGSDIYYDYFNPKFAAAATQAGSTLNLPPDNYTPPDTINREDRTAGAVLVLQQIPKPIMLSGVVYHDRDQSVMQGAGEEGIAGVALTLQQWNGTSYVDTGLTAVTNANGEYKFNGLLPGKYRVVESQPTGWLSTGSKAGTVNGTTRGTTSGPDLIVEVTLDGGETSVRNDFGEILPAKISGHVWADANGDCVFQVGEVLLSGVKMELLSPTGSVISTTYTDANGEYKFTNLAPGEYQVRETQPVGYFDSGEMAGSHGGVILTNDLISQVLLKSADNAVHYDFCEELPAQLSGKVWADPQGDCNFETGGILLSGVVIELLDANGNVIATTTTDANGRYEFTNLRTGTYSIREQQPAGYYQGGTHVGSLGGVKGTDLVTSILLGAGENGINYDFCENIPASLAGRVWVEVDMNCVYNPGEQLLSGVRVDLLDENGIVINTTFTNAQGEYLFVNLQPGKIYAVRETQPQNYFQGGTMAGSSGGIVPFADNINQIVLDSGEAAVNYDFCEIPQSKLSGYVFQDGPAVLIPPGTNPDIYATKTGVRGVGSIPIAGVRMLLGDINGNPVYDENGQPRITYTNAAGYYEFNGLQAGLYTVRQIQPDDYIDSIDTAGTTSGFPINLNIIPGSVPLFILADLNIAHNNDLIARINVPIGGASAENNFSEIRVVTLPPENPPPTVIPPPVEYYPAPPYTPPTPGTPLSFANLLPYISPEVINRLYLDGTRVVGNTWHLSVIDAGQPRTDRPDEAQLTMVSMLNLNTWKGVSLESTQWTLAARDGQVVSTPVFGNNYGIPVPGDYNGDGITEIAVYIKGEWFVDLNGNGKWDAEDLWAKLGTDEDLPVVGDWDGDGKDDIGIYGPAWPRDPEAIQREPGLPIVTNPNTGKSKNMPPLPEEATLGKRALKRSMTGKMRADLIDHVFNYGVAGDQPVAGDWTGQGSDAIGVFRNGEWHLDVNGDGKFDDNDLSFTFGQAGDKGVIGDWDGDGVDDLGVYRDGKFILDTNNNRTLDDSDLHVTPANGASGIPVAGDWDGDGRDEVGVMEVGKELPAKSMDR
jgi:serine-aspartate repeat-containing protein C/D/E